MAEVVLQGITKRYGEVTAVEDVDLRIEDGEFAVLVGPSGCGKSTTLRMVAGLESITSGELRIGDKRMNDVHPKDRDIAMVFQSYALYPHMNVRQNMGFGLRMRGANKVDIEKKVREAADILGLADLLERKPKELSGGQRQRVAMGRAIVRDPAVFLFDEPLSNLDAKLRVQMRAEIVKLHRRIGTTILYVTHDQVEAMTLADRIVVMEGGVVQQEGSPLEVFERPRNHFVAGFIGSPAMNFVPATLEDGTLVGADFSLPVHPDHGDLVARRSGPVELGLRPEHLSLLDGDPGDRQDVLRCILDVAERLGSETYLYLSLGDRMVAVRADARSGVQPGDAVIVEPDMQRAHLFDRKTGEAIF